MTDKSKVNKIQHETLSYIAMMKNIGNPLSPESIRTLMSAIDSEQPNGNANSNRNR